MGHYVCGPGFTSGKERKSTNVADALRLRVGRNDRDLGIFSIRLQG
jgi:hypothetical protein